MSLLLIIGIVNYYYNLGIGSFSEAILDYCANIDSAPYPDISKDRFNDEIFTVFEVMFNVWATATKDAKVMFYCFFCNDGSRRK